MEKLAEQFSVVTGASKEIGLKLLEVTNGDLEMAVTMQIDGLGPDVSDGSSESRDIETAINQTSQQDKVINTPGEAEDNVRPPIPRRWDILNPQPLMAVPPRRRPRGGKSSVFDPFRDFAAETRHQEEMLRTGQIASSSKSKRKTLEDLFRPPIDLMFSGSFHAVREAGQSAGKWLMVNVQNTQEFNCQKLNRDVWSDPTVKSIIKESFVFWQVFHDSEDGLKYSQFYNVSEYPYVAILDPRTGELMVTWHHLDTVAFCDLVMDFLTTYPCFDAATGQSPPCKKESIVDADEERQLKAAIDASLEESCQPLTESCESSGPSSSLTKENKSPLEPCGNTTIDLTSDADQTLKVTDIDSESEISVSDDGFSFSESDSEKTNGEKQSQRKKKNSLSLTSKSSEPNANTSQRVDVITINSDNGLSSVPDSDSKDGEETSVDEEDEVKIVLRFPDGKRKEVTFKPMDTLRDLQGFVIKEGFSNERYELVTNFPLRRLCILDIDSTLMAAKLYPRETVFIQER
ncbi:UBX domain-containing protein 7-like isoform X2 [Apostichopus japonicus]|uniref:UBX domain-containing protein 7-like isoform X2 n=1 Tax=Stichopus japonicus TaxID=307972 RepID=UPI003AB5BE5A